MNERARGGGWRGEGGEGRSRHAAHSFGFACTPSREICMIVFEGGRFGEQNSRACSCWRYLSPFFFFFAATAVPCPRHPPSQHIAHRISHIAHRTSRVMFVLHASPKLEGIKPRLSCLLRGKGGCLRLIAKVYLHCNALCRAAVNLMCVLTRWKQQTTPCQHRSSPESKAEGKVHPQDPTHLLGACCRSGPA